MRVTMVRCIFLVFFMVITTISSYGQNEEQKMMGEAKLKEESLQTRDTLSYALNDVVIKGSAKSMRITDNSVIMNIANTELAKKGKLLDILAYMPFVSKQNNNIIVAGKGEPIFYLNGHRLYESSELEKLLASDIKDIEVVTSPGAEYDASAKAVIKIRTIKPKGAGFSGNVESTLAYLGNHKLSEIPRSNFNYRTGGLDVFASLNLRDTRTKSESDQNMSLTNEDTYAQNETSVTRNTWLGYDGNIGMDYTAKSWNFGIKYAFTKTPYNKATTEGDVQVMKNEETFYDLWLKNATDINMLVQNLSAYAIYDLSKHSKLFMDWYLSKSDNDTEQDIEEIYTASSPKNTSSHSSYSNKFFAGKLEMQHTFNFGNIKYGTECSQTRYTTAFENKDNSLLTPASSSLRKEKTIAAYTSLTLKSDFMTTSAGMRYEYCKVNYESSDYDDSWNESNWFPFISLQKRLGKVKLSVSYTNKIKRPVYYSFRNNVTYRSPFEYSTGNPSLKSTFYHTISSLLSYKNLSASVTYEAQKHPVFYMIRQYGDNNAVMVRPENVKSYKHLVVTGNWFTTLGPWTPYISASLEKPFLKIEYTQYNKMRANIELFNTFSTHQGYNFDVNFSFSSGGNQNIMDRKANSMFQLGAYKNFLGENLYVGIYYMDVFKTQKSKYTILLNNVWLHKTSYDFNNGIYVTAIYKFNNANSRYHGNQAGLSEKARIAM